LCVWLLLLLLCLPPGDYGGDGYEDDGADGFAAGGDLLGGVSLLEAAAEAEAGGLRPWAALAGAGRADGLPDWMGGGDDSSGEPSYEELCRCAWQWWSRCRRTSDSLHSADWVPSVDKPCQHQHGCSRPSLLDERTAMPNTLAIMDASPFMTLGCLHAGWCS
jgi:hypothetical protein